MARGLSSAALTVGTTQFNLSREQISAIWGNASISRPIVAHLTRGQNIYETQNLIKGETQIELNSVNQILLETNL